MRLLKSTIYIACIATVFAGCDTGTTKHPDTLSTGSIDISVDETYKPVIEDELRVFDSAYPNAHITAHYKSEEDCFKDYFDNKARIILVTRTLTKAEKELCDQKQIFPSSVKLARDAVAVIVNKGSTDSMDIDEIKGILTGAYQKKKYTAIFDNQGSSTLRYVTDSLLRGQKLASNVTAAKGSDDLVEYVSKNPDAIGFVSISYVSDPNDTANTGAFTDKVKVVAIKNDTLNQFFKPYQAYIALRRYPLIRDLYYVSREGYLGLGTGFANFLGSARGQLIFAHDHFVPQRMSITIRDAEINR